MSIQRRPGPPETVTPMPTGLTMYSVELSAAPSAAWRATADELNALRVQKAELALLRRDLSERADAGRPDQETVRYLLALPLPDFATAGQCLEVRVPWYTESLWFAPDKSAVERLVSEGISRGRIWTAHELLDLLSVRPSRESAQTVARAKLAFDGDVAGVRPGQPPPGDPGPRA